MPFNAFIIISVVFPHLVIHLASCKGHLIACFLICFISRFVYQMILLLCIFIILYLMLVISGNITASLHIDSPFPFAPKLLIVSLFACVFFFQWFVCSNLWNLFPLHLSSSHSAFFLALDKLFQVWWIYLLQYHGMLLTSIIISWHLSSPRIPCIIHFSPVWPHKISGGLWARIYC